MTRVSHGFLAFPGLRLIGKTYYTTQRQAFLYQAKKQQTHQNLRDQPKFSAVWCFSHPLPLFYKIPFMFSFTIGRRSPEYMLRLSYVGDMPSRRGTRIPRAGRFRSSHVPGGGNARMFTAFCVILHLQGLVVVYLR